MDELLVKSFVDIVQRKYDEGQLSGPPRGSPEHQLLTQALMPGFQWGIAAAAVQFVILRRVPIHVTKRYTQQKIPSASKRESILFRTPPKDAPSLYSWKQYLWPRLKKGTFKEGLLLKTVTLPIDLAMSVMVGAAVWVWNSSKEAVMDDLTKLPLLESSPIAHTLCDDFIQQSDRIPPNIWSQYNSKDNYSILSLHTFIQNCRSRQQQQQQQQQSNQQYPTEWTSNMSPQVIFNDDDNSSNSDPSTDIWIGGDNEEDGDLWEELEEEV